MSYVVVPFELFDARLRAAGFVVDANELPRGTREVVYGRIVEEKSTRVRVFSGYVGGSQRGCGEDAIRVQLVGFIRDAGGRHFPRVVKGFPKVLRTGSPSRVLERTLNRAREAWLLGRGMGVCRACKGPAWADSGRCAVRCQP